MLEPLVPHPKASTKSFSNHQLTYKNKSGSNKGEDEVGTHHRESHCPPDEAKASTIVTSRTKELTMKETSAYWARQDHQKLGAKPNPVTVGTYLLCSIDRRKVVFCRPHYLLIFRRF
jgi:hypothetical protein